MYKQVQSARNHTYESSREYARQHWIGLTVGSVAVGAGVLWAGYSAKNVDAAVQNLTDSMVGLPTSSEVSLTDSLAQVATASGLVLAGLAVIAATAASYVRKRQPQATMELLAVREQAAVPSETPAPATVPTRYIIGIDPSFATA
jgi:hypothetical protein